MGQSQLLFLNSKLIVYIYFNIYLKSQSVILLN